MNIIPQRIMMLVLDNGKCPVEEWLKELRDSVTRARIIRQIDKLERGNFGIWRSVGTGVAELKIDFGPGYRVYFARSGNTTVILLGGGDKSTQSADIVRALDLWTKFADKDSSDTHLRTWSQDETETLVIKNTSQENEA